jgi:hypothetical protein
VTAAGVTVSITQGASSATQGGTVVRFQQGVNGYRGTQDRSISNIYAQWNGGEGITDVEGHTVYMEDDGTFQSRGLIRFGGINLPPGAVVLSATVTMRFTNWRQNVPPLTGYYIRAAWNGATTKTVSWKRRDTGLLWAAGGASAMGSDLLAGKSFTITGLTAAGDQTKTFALDPAVVQGWIANPASNQGILLVPGPNSRVTAYPSEAGNAALRPILTITYR